MDELTQIVSDRLKTLPPRCLRVFILVYHEQYLFKEVDAIQQLPPGTAELMYFRVMEEVGRVVREARAKSVARSALRRFIDMLARHPITGGR